MTKTTDDKNAAAPADFREEEAKANDLNYKQTDKTRDESGERNPEAVHEVANRNVPQPKPDVTLSRANETEEEAKERGAKAKAKGGTNNEPGMDKPVPASTPQKNQIAEGRLAATDYDRLEKDELAQEYQEDGRPVPMKAKSDNEVGVRVTKKGDGQVHKGGMGGTYSRGDTFDIDRKIAEDLEERGFVEID